MFTESAEKIGFPTDEYDFHNAYDPERGGWNIEVPQPVAAVLFLYVIENQQNDNIKEKLEEQASKEGPPADAKPLFLK